MKPFPWYHLLVSKTPCPDCFLIVTLLIWLIQINLVASVSIFHRFGGPFLGRHGLLRERYCVDVELLICIESTREFFGKVSVFRFDANLYLQRLLLNLATWWDPLCVVEMIQQWTQNIYLF